MECCDADLVWWRMTSTKLLILLTVSICQHATSVKSVYVSELCKFDNFCQPFGTNWWKYHSEHCLSCSSGKRYHCARDYDQPEVFKEGCAVEQFCPEGEEPKLSFLRDKKEITEPDVFCDDCYDKNRYNSRKNTSSAEFSECPHEKKNICTDEEHKKLCKPDDATDERYCRCDARKGYSPVNDFTHAVCSYENYDCKDYFKCDEGTQLLLNYTCGDNCPVGFDRISENNDNCFQIIKTETTESPVLSPSTTKNNFPSSSYIVPNTTVHTQNDCLEACDVYEVCEKGKCVCPNSCANLVKPVCGYHELSGKYQTFSSNCELRKTYCREREFQYYSIGECKKGSSEAGAYRNIIIGIGCAFVMSLILCCIIYKSRLGKKIRDRFCPYPGNREIEIPPPITEVDGSNQTGKYATTADGTSQIVNGTTTKQNGKKQDNSNIKRQSSAPLSSLEDVSTPNLSTIARKVSSPKMVVHKTKNIYLGPVITSKDGETMISIGNGSYDKNSMVKIMYNKDDEKEEGETVPLLEGGEFSSDNNPSSVPNGIPSAMLEDAQYTRVLPKEATNVFFEKPDATDLADNEVTKDANNDREAPVDTVNEPEINAHGLNTKVETDVGDGNHVSQRLRKQSNPHSAKLGSFYRSRKDSMSCDSLFLEPKITAIHVLCENRDERKELINRVMDRSSGYLLDNMDPIPVIDKFTAKEILTNVLRRNILDLQIQTDKTREIIKRIRETGMQNYQLFKNCLWETKQISCLDEVQKNEKTILHEIQTASHHNTQSSFDREKRFSAESHKTQANDENEVSRELSDDHNLVFEQNDEDIPRSDTGITSSGENDDKRRYEGQKTVEKDPSSWQPLEELEQLARKNLNDLTIAMEVMTDGGEASTEKYLLFEKMCREISQQLPDLTRETLIPDCRPDWLQNEEDYKKTPEGFRAFRTSGKDNSCFYQTISMLLTGTENIQHCLRLLATLHAEKYFKIYKKQLIAYDVEKLKLFFGSHVNHATLQKIANMDNAEAVTEVCLKTLIMETACLGTDSSVLHVEFLCGGLGANIRQHFQQHYHYGAEMETIPWENIIQGDNCKQDIPELNIFWVNFKKRENGEMNHIVPLLPIIKPTH